MIKYVCLAASLVLVSSTSAQACSPIPEVRSGVQYYRSITSNQYQSWFSTNLSVGLVYAKKKKERKREVVSGFEYEKAKKPFVKIKFKLIEDISGDFIPDEPKWFPKMAEGQKASELNRIAVEKAFSFWDRRDLTIPNRYGYASNTSCGPSPSNTLLPNQYYLQFKENNRTIGFEIVSGSDDTLVENFRQIQTGLTGSKIRREAKDYLSEMAGFIEVRITECPLQDKYEPGFGFIHRPWGPTDDLPKPFETIDSYKTDLKDLNLIDFYAYIAQTPSRKLSCRTSDRYLVLDRLSARTYRGQGSSFSVTPPQHRFLKIENSQINTQDILSRISIHSDGPIDIDDVKSWIKAASP